MANKHEFSCILLDTASEVISPIPISLHDVLFNGLKLCESQFYSGVSWDPKAIFSFMSELEVNKTHAILQGAAVDWLNSLYRNILPITSW